MATKDTMRKSSLTFIMNKQVAPPALPYPHLTKHNSPSSSSTSSEVTHTEEPLRRRSLRITRATRPRQTLDMSTAKPQQKRSEKKKLTNEEKRRTRTCKADGCDNYIINKGLCFRHGGGKKCTYDNCQSSAKNAGRCWKHGGSLKCLIKDCDRRGKSRGLCWAHGGGTKCTISDCSKVAVSLGFCWAHGGGKRCAHDGCKRAASERLLNYCVTHYSRFKDGNETTVEEKDEEVCKDMYKYVSCYEL